MSILSGKCVALLQGGPGSERRISLATAEGVHAALEKCGATVIDVDVTGTEVDLPEGVDLAFNVIHGTFGEDGALQEILERLGVPYTGAGVAASRLAFDKIESKKRFVEEGVPTPDFELIDLAEGGRPRIPLPFVIKPPCEGSSVGVHIVMDAAQVDDALKDVARYGRSALVEKFVVGKELTVGVLGDQALPVIHIRPKSGFYDMNNKYPWLGGGGGTEYICPADITDAQTAAVQDAALHAHRALGIEVYSRVDVLLGDDDGNPYVLEVNTIPGMTASSLLPKAAAAAGIEFPDLCSKIAELSLKLRSS